MKKYFYLLLFALLAVNLHAQRDTEHWFAPMKAAMGSGHQQALFLSTDSVVPFQVSVFSNNILQGTVTISKGNPQQFNVDMDRIIAKQDWDTFAVIDKGLYVTGSKPFFATLRFSVTSHGEILTSKGKAGIGTKFYAVNAPTTINTSIENFTVGILATEDNTNVTVSGYDPAIQFSNGQSGTVTPITFTLNKGQSYLIEGLANIAANREGFIGAKIESNKPVSVTNGNFGGNYVIGNASTGTDIIMDQSVPTTRLGKDFVLIKGYGGLSDGTEGAIVVAAEDNTTVSVNGGPVLATLNEGEHYRVLSSAYINMGTPSNQHYNMFLQTSKNAYVYQLLSGIAGSNNQSGFNYIPPLSCYLPRTIDEIGLINVLPGAPNPMVKLNILTETGATVTVNGITPTAAQGPFPVTGTANWVSYSILNVTGNYTITSDKAVTAGIAGGSGAVGYGGYFAGFSSVPVISKVSGECAPGIILSVDDIFTTYQWNRNGVPIAGANSHTYAPLISGNYTCTVSIGTCPPVTTPPYPVQNCMFQSVRNESTCDQLTIVPAFSAPNTQTVVPSTVTIVTQPTLGTVTIDPATGVITYIRNPGATGPDSFVFKFCGNDPVFTDCEQILVNILPPVYPVVYNNILKGCFLPEDPSKGTFNLNNADVTSTPNIVYKFYPSLVDAQNDTNAITSTSNYISGPGKIWVRAVSNTGCFSIAELTLQIVAPKLSAVLQDKVICEDSKTDLDAGPNYTSYKWSTGATTQVLGNVGVGEYWVELGHEGCKTKQFVRVKKAQSPVVTHVDVTNNTVTLTVQGGNPPYKYSKDGVTWQDSNVFSGLPRGENTFYVKDSFNCNPVSITVTVPNLINAITPNGDNVNDVIDYRALAYKDNLTFTVYDRYGKMIHTADKNSGYSWNGYFQGKKLTTGTYWYSITWNEPNDSKTLVKYNGWVMVKNH